MKLFKQIKQFVKELAEPLPPKDCPVCHTPMKKVGRFNTARIFEGFNLWQCEMCKRVLMD